MTESTRQLLTLMDRLLADDGCPWDRAQTPRTLRPYVLEEAHEVVEAIDSGDPKALREELGDLLFQVVFLSAMAERNGWFSFDDVASGIHEKMVRRHPWVFGEERADDEDAAIGRWEAIKAKEKAERGETEKKSALDGVPRALPALLRALRVGEKAGAVGYDWGDVAGARAKVNEELVELDEALDGDDDERIEAELGDVLFALASVARKRRVDPESALRTTLERFGQRFRIAEELAGEAGLRALDNAQRDNLWEQAKEKLRGK